MCVPKFANDKILSCMLTQNVVYTLYELLL